MIDSLINLIRYAGTVILEIYNNDDFEVVIKEDKSPLTKADLLSHEVLTKGLQEILKCPVLSEEENIDYEIRKNWNEFWLIDPLDGTKDFIVKNDQFTINIALVKNNEPILGLIYAPALNLLYYAQKNLGAYKNGEKIYNYSKRKELIAVDSIFHSSGETLGFIKINNIKKTIRCGSAIKFCKLAEGEIDLYPRFNGTKEWDTAAGQIILEESGCKLIDMVTKDKLFYNKVNIKNNYFIALRNDLEIDSESNCISRRAGCQVETDNG